MKALNMLKMLNVLIEHLALLWLAAVLLIVGEDL
jgi:hypothetical protein